MEDNMLISIVVPIFNAERYIKRCIDSILAQTWKDIEIICIDDGSTDDSSQIIDQYSGDRRIKVLHKENGGSTSARKAGVDIASGEYIGFVDSDDWIEPDMYERLFYFADCKNVDLVTCGYYLEGNYTTMHLDTVEEGLYNYEQIQYLRENTIYRMNKKETGLRGSLCCKLFKTSLVKAIMPDIPNELVIAEDKMWLLRYILECNSAYVLKEPYYHWEIHANSMSHTENSDYLIKINSVYNYLINLYNHPHFTATMRTQAEIYIIELLFLGINKRMGFKNKNMIWIDPYWMDRLPQNSKVVFYGGGELGEKYKKQLLHTRPDVELVACVDPQYQILSNEYLKVDAPETLKELLFDYIVITIKNKGKAENVKEELIYFGISDEKIIWCEQPEAYWRFIEAEGLL